MMWGPHHLPIDEFAYISRGTFKVSATQLASISVQTLPSSEESSTLKKRMIPVLPQLQKLTFQWLDQHS